MKWEAVNRDEERAQECKCTGAKIGNHGEGRRREEERKKNNLFTQGDYIERNMTTRLHLEVF